MHRRRLATLSSTVVLLVLVVAGASGCDSNISGKISAVGTGDVTTPPMPRIAPESVGPCGKTEVTAMGKDLLRRLPYLQQVTSSSATVVWTAADGDGPASVMLTEPDGTVVQRSDATVDTTAPLPRGSRQWTATAVGLQPGATVCYEIRHADGPVVKGGSITTAPLPETGAPVRILAIGDSGDGGSDQHALLKQIDTVPFDLMVHTGDIAYDSGTLGDFETKFFGVYGGQLSRAPVFPASGNHEYETADAAPYRQVFRLPENGGPAGLERWYSYDWGDIHFVALDTERTGTDQANWLEADLAANRLPWTIVYGHRPPLSSGEHGDDQRFQSFFMPVLEKHKVDLVLTGHDHHYERFKPVNGVTYVVTGGGGRGVRLIGSKPSTAFAEPVIHLVAIEVQGNQLTLHAIDGVGREFDSAVIQKVASDKIKRNPDSGA